MEPMFEASNKKYSIAMKKPLKASPPVVLCQDIPPGTKFTFVDIAHSLATINIESKMNRFSALIDTANDWLRKNYLWKILSCETVPLVFKSEKLDLYDYGATKRLLQPHISYDLGETIVLKSLRLWIMRRDDMPEMKRNIETQFISYSTFMPKSCQYFNNQIGWEQLGDVVETINDSIRSGEIKGKLLNIESVNYDANHEWIIDTECPKQKEFTSKQVTIIRVYYEIGEKIPEDIAIFDFVPQIIYASATHKFEKFSSLLCKVQDFFEDNCDLKFLSAQSFDIKYRNADDIQTHFMIHNNDIGYFLRILRITCIKPLISKTIRRLEKQNAFDETNQIETIQSPSEQIVSDICQLKLDSFDNPFEPSTSALNKKQTILNIESHYFEIVHHNTLHGPFYPVKRAIEEFMEREEWNEVEKYKWNFLYAETVVVVAKDENDISKKIENSLFSNRHNVLFVPRVYYVIRLYFDTCLVGRKNLSLIKSKSFQKDNQLVSKRQKSLPEYKSKSDLRSEKSVKNKFNHSISCLIM